MTLIHYNPNRAAARVNRDVDSIFDSFFNFPSVMSSDRWAFVPKVDIVDNKENVSIVAEIPGMEKDDIKIMIEDGVLTISGERKTVSESKDESYVRCELCSGSFARSFTLPDHLELDKITADYKNGMLTILLPKSEKSKPKEIKVAVK